MKNNSQNNYIEEIKEYGNKQYMPGSYAGSSMPPFVKYHRNKSLKIFAGLILLGIITFFIYSL